MATINNPQMVIAHVRRDAVAEFQTFLQLNPVADAGAALPAAAIKASPPEAKSDKDCIGMLLQLASNTSRLDDAQARAGRKLLAYDGEVYPHDACAITLSTLLQDAGADVPDVYQAIMLGRELRGKRNWQTIPLGQHQAGDVGSTCGEQPDHGHDHIYFVFKKVNDDEMLIADNQQPQPHSRFVSGQGRTPTKFFLRAT